MTKENGYIWITDEVDSCGFSMVAPKSGGYGCHTKPTGGCKSCGKEMKNKINNERIIQVAVAWAGGVARNRIDSDIHSDDESGQKELNLCCGGLLPLPGMVTVAGESEESEKDLISKNYNLESLEGDFSITISKDGEVTVNGLKAEK